MRDDLSLYVQIDLFHAAYQDDLEATLDDLMKKIKQFIIDNQDIDGEKIASLKDLYGNRTGTLTITKY